MGKAHTFVGGLAQPVVVDNRAGAELIRNDRERWAKVIKDAGIRID